MEFDIDNQTWIELNQLLDEVLDLPDTQREAWLRGMEVHYKEQQPKLWSFLVRAAQVETQDFLKAPPKIGVPTGAEEESRDSQTGSAGETIGPYRLLRELGSGGMGAVWLAERTDGMMKRPVALKLPHDSFIARHAGLAERLEREREILATLNHPNIATLYDAGVDGHGQPYLALEYVEGEPIDRYCNTNLLNIRARLTLFLQVANAVAHAHAKLIVHRDLKPSNILVTHEGEVRLLDFGIAKLLEPGGEKKAPLTEFGGRALTPDYAAPEQILGEQITIAADVYSLGVILYELLAGVRPYTLKCDTRGALEDAIVHADVLKPSEVANKADCKVVRGDLDTIVLKALKKQPQNRYATVNSLIEDIERYVEGRVVLAQADSSWYRTRKFVRRHRGGVLTAALMVVVLMASATITTWQSIEARQQRDIAIYNQQRAIATNEFMSLLLEGVSTTGEGMTMTELLERGTKMLEQQYQEQPFLGALYQNIASRYLGIGEVDRALELLAHAERLAREENDVDVLANVLCQTARAELLLRGSSDKVLSDIGNAIRLFESNVNPTPSTRVQCARAEAGAMKYHGDFDGAISILQSTLDVLNTSPAKSSMHTGVLLNDLTITYIQTGQIAEALVVADKAIEVMRNAGRSETVGMQTLELNRSNLLAAMGEISLARVVRERLVTQIQEIRGPEGVPAFYRLAYAASLIDLAQYEEALEVLHETRKATESTGNAYLSAGCDIQIASALVFLGRASEALTYLDRSAEFLARTPDGRKRGLNDIAVIRTKMQLAIGDVAAAKTTIEAVLKELDYPTKKEGSTLLGPLSSATRVAIANGDGLAALQFASDSLVVATDIARNPEASATVGRALLLRAKARELVGNASGAREDLVKAIPSLENGLNREHPDSIEARELLATLQQ